MLSEEVIEKVSERLVNRIEQGNEYVLKKNRRKCQKNRHFFSYIFTRIGTSFKVWWRL